MSTGGDDESRPSRVPRPSVPRPSVPRPTTRDVPIAKIKEASVGTVPPRGLRGQSLQPGQGAPERIVPEEIELAALREPATLDGLQVARAAPRRLPELTRSPPPTPVSVEVPRMRSLPPDLEAYGITPSTPSARSVQSGTLMSIGSVDPRAPTELSLPSPRSLSQSERAAYFGPGAVVDRSPASVPPSGAPSDVTARAARAEFAGLADPLAPEPIPQSSARSMPVGSGPPVSSARRSQKPDSPAPPARHFGRAPHSYSPVSTGSLPPAPHSPLRASEPPQSEPPQYEIHAQLDALPRELGEDSFDLRSVSTQREPLASRKPMESSDWTTVHEPVSVRRESPAPSERGLSRGPSSSSAITILTDPAERALADLRHSLPSLEPVAPQRASVPVSWVLAGAGFALLLALIVAWVMRAQVNSEALRPMDERGQAAPLRTALSPRPALTPPAAAAQGTEQHNPASASPSSQPKAGASRGLESSSNSAVNPRTAPPASAHASEPRALGSAAPEGSAKAKSIY